VDGKPIHETGLRPTVIVQEPNVAFGATPPTEDPILSAAIEHLRVKKAA
jgi:hypothetical protein